jgi:hypothetical protein
LIRQGETALADHCILTTFEGATSGLIQLRRLKAVSLRCEPR